MREKEMPVLRTCLPSTLLLNEFALSLVLCAPPFFLLAQWQNHFEAQTNHIHSTVTLYGNIDHKQSGCKEEMQRMRSSTHLRTSFEDQAHFGTLYVAILGSNKTQFALTTYVVTLTSVSSAMSICVIFLFFSDQQECLLKATCY